MSLKTFLLGIGFGLAFWIGASAVEAFVFNQDNFFTLIFSPDQNEFAIRIWIIVLIFIVLTGSSKSQSPD
ncbi:MAG: hypothetical protein HYR79_09570 [Nitrospirae bacterium]|nr:hypothetical protein [Nitrospirota bacterium]